jgi:hypothetical protein
MCCLRISTDLTAIMNEIAGAESVFFLSLFSFPLFVGEGERTAWAAGVGGTFERLGDA